MAGKKKGNEAALAFLRSKGIQLGPGQQQIPSQNPGKEVAPFKDAAEHIAQSDSQTKGVHSRVTALASKPANQTENLDLDGKDAGQVVDETNPKSWETMSVPEKLDLLRDIVFALNKKATEIQSTQEALQLSMTAAFSSGKEGEEAEKHITTMLSEVSDRMTNVQMSAIPKWIREIRDLRIKQNAMYDAWKRFEQDFVRPLGTKVRELVAIINKMSVDDFNNQLAQGSKPDRQKETEQKPKKSWFSRKTAD